MNTIISIASSLPVVNIKVNRLVRKLQSKLKGLRKNNNTLLNITQLLFRTNRNSEYNDVIMC